MSLNFGPTVNAQLVALAGLDATTVDASTFEIVTIDPANPTTVVRCTTTATIPTADLIGALISYFSPPGSTSVTAAVVIHGDGTTTPAQYAAANTWAGLTSAGVEISGGDYVRQPLTWVVGTTATAQVSFKVPVGTTVDGIAFFNIGTGGTANSTVTVAAEQFGTTEGVYTPAITYNET